MSKVTVKLDPEQIVVVSGNHGGYLTGECLACGALGWIDGRFGLKSNSPDAREWRGSHLVHKRSCQMNQFALLHRDGQ